MKKVDAEGTVSMSLFNLVETLTNDVSDAELQAIEAETIGWVYLTEGAYIHEGSGKSGLIQVVGIVETSMIESNILWLI